jgi:hypothetical protein
MGDDPYRWASQLIASPVATMVSLAQRRRNRNKNAPPGKVRRRLTQIGSESAVIRYDAPQATMAGKLVQWNPVRPIIALLTPWRLCDV